MLKVVIIDDEAKSCLAIKEMLETYCTTDVTVVEMCNSVPSAIPVIHRYEPDVVFSDIEMPNYSGFELLDFFKEITFELVFVTAYSEYATRAFETSAIDYILKPLCIDRLETTVEKIKSKQANSTMQYRLDTLKENLENKQLSKIALPISDGLLFTDIRDIAFMEADGSYTRVWNKDGTSIMVCKTLKSFDKLLTTESSFVRVHRSFIVNVEHIKKYNRNENYILMDNSVSVSISRNRKSEFEKAIERIKI